ncbi:MAG: hypothetical protein K6E10_10460 [Eubacterium sp.]|nr:hypothetical protein [Eubacterium sp.]
MIQTSCARMLMRSVLGVTEIFIEKAFFPEVLEHTVARIPFEIDPAKVVPIIPALIISSFIFAIGHFSYGNPAIVAVNLAGVFIDSIFFGLVFKETDNVLEYPNYII